MSQRTTRSLIALVAAGVLLWFITWLDNDLLARARLDAAATFQQDGYAMARSLALLLVIGGVLTVAVAARWAHSLWVAIPYLLVGAFFAFLPALYFGPAASVNNGPPLLPEPLVSFIGYVYFPTGPLGAHTIFGAGLLVVGAISTILVLRDRPAEAGAQAIQ